MANRVAKKDLIEVIKNPKGDPEQQLELLKNIVISEAKSDADKELFTLVASAIKKTLGSLKSDADKVKGKFKVKIAGAKEKLDTLKEAQAILLGPLSDLTHELKRIDTEARAAISAFATNQMAALEEEFDDLEPHEKAMLPAAENKITRVKGVAMSFRDHTVVEVHDIKKVPVKFLVKEAERVKVMQWFVAKTGIAVSEITVQSNGSVMIKIPTEDLPDECKDVVGVKDAAIISAGGCPGVDIKTEKRPVVKG